MKRKYIILVMLLVGFGLFTMQSCTKTSDTVIAVHHAFTVPEAVAPLDGDLVHTGSTVDLTWTSTNADGAASLNDVYFGTKTTPALFKSGNSGLKITVPVEAGLTYYWNVVMKDANGITTTSPTWSFTIYDPISVFIGNYTVDEPEEGWTYVVSFAKVDETTLKIGKGAGPVAADNMAGWWASWVNTFILDWTAKTYTMPKKDFGGGYEGEESGTFDPVTGTLTGTYTVWSKGAIIEHGLHTYTKQ